MENNNVDNIGASVEVKSVKNGFICTKISFLGSDEYVFQSFTEVVNWMADALGLKSNPNERIIRICTIGGKE